MKKSQHIKKTMLTLLRRKTIAFFSLLLVGLLATGMVAFAQRTITGRVTNEQGAAVPRASVVVKGTTTGTVTNDNGDYSIVAAKGAVLVISNVSYTDLEITVGDDATINARLVLSSGSLDEVVVVGYGTQKKRDITGAITKVNSDVLMRTASHNVLDQLKGRAAGVNITSTSSVPGGGSQIRIRGNRTMVANTTNQNLPSSNPGGQQQLEAATADQADAPLLVVDGIPYSGNLNDISPNDIASLEILKDASATAIYGSRGAGGVILVTTKRGNSGKVRFNYDGYYGMTRVMQNLRVFNGAEYAQFKLDAAAGHSTTPGSQPWPNSAAETAAIAAGVSTDWQDLIYQTGAMTNHNISASGGTDKSRFSMSFGYFLQEGVIPNQNYKRYNIRSSMDHQVSKRIRIGVTTINSVGVQNTPGGSGVTSGLMRITPLANPYNPDGTVNLQILTGGTDNLFNPLTLKTRKEAILARNRRLRTFNSFYGEVDLIKGLKYRINVGLDYYQDKGDVYSGPGTYVNTALAQSASTASIRNTEFWQYTIENLLMYEKTIKEKHRIGITALYSAQKSQSTSSYVAAIGVPFDFIQNTNFYTAASVNAGPDGANYMWERGLVSLMGRITYSFDNRYSATATMRHDESSVLAPGNQSYTYPAFALAWNIMNEKFMSSMSFISNLKLRAGWGIAASQGINPYETLGLLNNTAYNFGQTTAGQQGGYAIFSLPNEKLKWQSTSQFNFGLDFGLWRNRLTGSIEIYNQKTKDILLPVSLPISNGADRAFLNLGKTKASGFELTLNSINIKKADFSWSTDFNFFLNREKIVQLTSPTQMNDIGNGWFVGQPISVIYDYRKLGIWQTGDHGLITQTSPIQKPGDIRLEDVNGDNMITAADRQVIGNFQPKFEAGLSNTVNFKGFDISVDIFARIGMKVVVPYLSSEPGGSFFAGYNWFLTGRNNQLKVDYWTPTNPTNKFPQPDALAPPQYNSVLSYVDGSFVKCRNINLGYNLSKRMIDKLGGSINSFRIYVSAVNPFMIYAPFVKEGYGPDPEGNGYGGAVAGQGTGGQAGTIGRQITVNANNPATRQFIFGVNLNF
ncbi:MAG TPA: TonB-dependent receptor [Chitinophagaceae bacterium]|jgi:TonB-linked SusC/RagA family outer membrane protein|nr:TonB-dependent receptor [Chitinophagaceae bacterium]